VGDRSNLRTAVQFDTPAGAEAKQHIDNLPRRAIAEQLAQRLFVPGDAVLLDQRKEILRGIAAERRLGEMRVLRKVAVRRGVQVGEIAPPAARNQDLLSRRVGRVEQDNPPPALASLSGAEQAGCASSQNDRVVGDGQRGNSLTPISASSTARAA
jgi:hypothetical protein